MNILHVIDSMNPVSGGPSQGVRNIDKDLRNMDVFGEVVCLDPPDSAYLGKDSFKIHALGHSEGAWHYSKALIPWLTDNFKRFDVVIIRGLWQYHSYATHKVIRALKRKSGAKLPVVLIMPHGMLDPYFQRAKERKIKALRNWLYWKLIENKVVNNVDGLLFTCEAELLLARETFRPYHPKNVYNVSYGIEAPPAYNSDMAAAFSQHCSKLAGQPYFLFLSRLHEKKGVDILIEAYTALGEQYPVIPKLVIAGPGLETVFGERIQKMANKNTFSKNNIFFTGMLTGNAKWGAYYGCDAFVLPSHQENFGIAVAEALACSKPVLISDQVNIWREINNGGIIGSDTFEGTKEIIEKWLNLSGGEKKSMSDNAWKIYHDNFESTPAAQKFYNVLRSLVLANKSKMTDNF
ncbi:MAG: glycosyl transferase family 1 [Mucilaginibacter sp.]|nr:glycosyl transferase family 1 [Mucilaginibacter sp.]